MDVCERPSLPWTRASIFIDRYGDGGDGANYAHHGNTAVDNTAIYNPAIDHTGFNFAGLPRLSRNPWHSGIRRRCTI